jgi:hypothetical protein
LVKSGLKLKQRVIRAIEHRGQSGGRQVGHVEVSRTRVNHKNQQRRPAQINAIRNSTPPDHHEDLIWRTKGKGRRRKAPTLNDHFSFTK